MGRRVILTTLAISFCLLAGRAAFAEPVDFQTAVGSGTTRSAQTSQAGGGAAGPQQVQTVDLGDVTGTVCDCGEIPPAGATGPGATDAAPAKGGFPKFPLLAFAVAPLPCLFGICSSDPPRERPPDTPVPEPVTITMLAAGLAALAGLRTRRRV